MSGSSDPNPPIFTTRSLIKRTLLVAFLLIAAVPLFIDFLTTMSLANTDLPTVASRHGRPKALEEIVREWHVIADAPIAFFGLLVLGIGAAWLALNWRYSGQVENLQSGTKLRDDTIADYKDKLSGATPEEAKKRLDALETAVAALSPRRLSEEQKARLTSVASIAKATVSIASDAAASDARAFSRDVALAFQSAGWEVQLPIVMGLSNPPPSGVALRVINPTSLTAAETRTKSALEAASISYDLQPGAMRTPNQLPNMPPSPEAEIIITGRLDA